MVEVVVVVVAVVVGAGVFGVPNLRLYALASVFEFNWR